MLRALLASLRVVAFPPRCACELARPMNVETESGFCEACQETLEPAPQKSEIIAPTEYGGPVASAVVAAKFHRREASARALGRLLASHPPAQRAAAGASAIVPVPLSARRYYERGFNQAELIARECSRAWGIPVRPVLRRVRHTRPQSDLPVADRTTNVAGAFAATRRLRGRWLLVDDVSTSGATLSAAASALRDAGAEEVALMAASVTG